MPEELAEPKIRIEELSPILRRVSVELPPTAVDEALAEAYRELSRSVKIKGFRPGKVPRHVLERFYRAQVERDVAAQLVQSSYSQAVGDREDLFPVSEPTVENEALIVGQPFRYRAQVEVKPRLAPKDYVGFTLKARPAGVSEAEVEAELGKLQQAAAVLLPIEERTVGVAGDWALVDYELEVDGTAIATLERNRGQAVELTDGAIVQGHIPELRGVEVGQTIELSYGFPADYKVHDLRGKTGLFRVTLMGLRRREVPALDDELVKDLDDPELATLDQLRERVRQRMRADREEQRERDLRFQIETALVEHNPFEAPPALVSRVAEAELRSLAQQIVRAGVDPKSLSIDPAKMRASAEQRIKAELLLEAIAGLEKLEVTDQDLQAHFERMAQATDEPLSKVKAQYGREEQREALKYRLLEDKALAFLRSKATIMEGSEGAPVVETAAKEGA